MCGYLGGVLSGERKSREGGSWGSGRGPTPKALSASLRGLAIEGREKPMKNLKHDMLWFGQDVVAVVRRMN